MGENEMWAAADRMVRVHRGQQFADRALRGQLAGRTMRTDFVHEVPPWERASLARFGEQEPPVGTVLRWRVADGSLHVAIRTTTWWKCDDGDQIGWRAVAERIGDAECHVALSWREIPRPEPEPAGDEAVRDWAAQFLPESPSEEIPLVTVDDEEA